MDKNKEKQKNELEKKLIKINKEIKKKKQKYEENRNSFSYAWKPRLGLSNEKDKYEKSLEKKSELIKKINSIDLENKPSISKNQSNSSQM